MGKIFLLALQHLLSSIFFNLIPIFFLFFYSLYFVFQQFLLKIVVVDFLSKTITLLLCFFKKITQFKSLGIKQSMCPFQYAIRNFVFSGYIQSKAVARKPNIEFIGRLHLFFIKSHRGIFALVMFRSKNF